MRYRGEGGYIRLNATDAVSSCAMMASDQYVMFQWYQVPGGKAAAVKFSDYV
jgi:hypothetical protein